MFSSQGKITPDLITLLRSWRYSGCQVYAGPRIQAGEEEGMENLTRYIIQASFSKDGKMEKTFNALE